MSGKRARDECKRAGAARKLRQLFVTTALTKQVGDVGVTGVYRPCQWRARFIGGINIGPVGEKGFDYILEAFRNRNGQGGIAL